MNTFAEIYQKMVALGDQKFLDLLDREVNISTAIRSEASTSQNHIRDRLNTENSRDSSFPRILSVNDTDFIGGSFARHTKIKPLDDIDIFFPIDGEGLNFTQNNIRYSVVGDNILLTNPILGSRWIDPGTGNISSKKLISEFCVVLKKWYPNSIVKRNEQAVTVRLKSVAVESADDPGLGFDIVPCFLVKTNKTNEHDFYVIPDGKDGWIRTNPRVDKNINETLHDYHKKHFRPIVKLVKFWNVAYFGGKINSYFIELSIMRTLIQRGTPLNSIQEGLSEAFRGLGNALLLKENPSPWIELAPEVSPGQLTDIERFTAYSVSLGAEQAYNHLKKCELEAADKKWKEIFKDL